ncbi:MAG TPA: 3-deoxy-manno-octulosonate cytidylyltransferase [Candidatus Dormibacteraeota bacterium]|nr:3-deoxy-manno-octulosonate cytidylyltransferase [Candidatus Dormibacteraeota bacterium]
MAIAVIPARYAATRLPGKPLVALAGKPMIQRVWERARQAQKISRVIIATDDGRIVQAAAAFGGEAAMTRSEHRSGTERVAEVAATIGGGQDEIFINVQGDEPLVEPEAIDTLVEAIESDESVAVATLMVPIARPADIMDPNIVKVVLDFDGNALYFSRAPIPWVRDRNSPVHVQHMKHLGLYGFRRAALLDFPTLPVGDLERIEQLEQLRWMENGYKIRVAETIHDSISVDVPEDVARVEQLLRGT